MAKTDKENQELETPLMKQYYSFKAKYPEALLLFRVGDFYETFGEDAIKTSEILGIVLPNEASRLPLPQSWLVSRITRLTPIFQNSSKQDRKWRCANSSKILS